MITAEQFAEWKEHPVTKEIYEELQGNINVIKDQLSTGQSIGESAEITHSKTSMLVGQLDGLNQLLNISFAEQEIDEVSNHSGY